MQAIILMPSSVGGHLTHGSHQQNLVIIRLGAPGQEIKNQPKEGLEAKLLVHRQQNSPVPSNCSKIQPLHSIHKLAHIYTHTFIPPQAQWHTDIFSSCGCLLLLSCKALVDFPPTPLSLTKILFFFFSLRSALFHLNLVYF